MVSNMPDLALKCVRCKSDFTFTEREQANYKLMEWKRPQRCQNCRRLRRAERQKPPKKRENHAEA